MTAFHLHPKNPHYFLFRGQPTLPFTADLALSLRAQ